MADVFKGAQASRFDEPEGPARPNPGIGKVYKPARGHREPWNIYEEARTAKRAQWEQERAAKERMAVARAAKAAKTE